MKDYTRRHRETLFAEAVAVIDATAGEIPSLEAVAREIATSRRQLQRVLRDVGGLSFREYVVQRRLEVAAGRLAHGAAVSVVAAAAGYRHVSHFSRAFKRHFGVPPSHWPHVGDRDREPERVAA